MDELKELMGEAYKDGMTLDDVANFMKGKKFGDLSSGKYVDIDKYNNTIQKLNNTIAEKDKKITDNMTDDQKIQKQLEDAQKENERLNQLLTENQLDNSKIKVQNTLNESVNILGIKSDDNEFIDFVTNITTTDKDITLKNANYINKLIKDSYEKGKKDSVRTSLGDFGKTQVDQPTSGGKSSIGAELAKMSIEQNNSTYDYFKK